VATAARARIDDATESAIRLGLPFFSSCRASWTTLTPARPISSGVSMVFSRATSTPVPERCAARNSMK
jgi:hypothetical protein